RAVGEVRVVAEAHPDVAAEGESRREQRPRLVAERNDAPAVEAVQRGGELLGEMGEVAHRRTDAAGDTENEGDVERTVDDLHVQQRVERGDVAGVVAAVLWPDAQARHGLLEL